MRNYKWVTMITIRLMIRMIMIGILIVMIIGIIVMITATRMMIG